jgi:tetratricopeptide (TPR) repeat protein
MRISGVTMLVVVAVAVSLPGMYFLNNIKGNEENDAAVDALCLKGLMCLGEGQHDKAIAAYSEAIKLDPEYSVSYLGRGDVHLAKKDLYRALLDYDCAARLDPGNDAAKERANLVRARQRKK